MIFRKAKRQFLFFVLIQIDSVPTDSLPNNSQVTLNNGIFFLIALIIILISLLIFFNKTKSEPEELNSFTKKPEPYHESPKPETIADDKELKKNSGENKTSSPPFSQPSPPHHIGAQSISDPPKIGYKSVKIFEQNDTVHFPIIIMPKENSWLKRPQEYERRRNIGITEREFKNSYLLKYFSGKEITDTGILNIADKSIVYEPDFVFNKYEKNLYVDIEIDEPYDGLGNPTHYLGSDDQRNYDFKKRGWIIIRFAESQIVRQPDSCCKIIAEVLDSVINSKYLQLFSNISDLETVKQWTKDESVLLVNFKYREKYLNRENIGIIN